jgi:hypothetical protein
MSEKLYNLEFSGRVIPGWDIDEVKANLAKLMKANEEKIYKLFSGGRFFIKKNIDHKTAIKILNPHRTQRFRGRLRRLNPHLRRQTFAPKGCGISLPFCFF